MDDTKNRILEATFKAVRQYGLDGVRIQNISSLAGLSPGALYRYFESKEELMDTCFLRVDKEVAQLFERVAYDPRKIVEDPVSVIRMLWQPYFRFWVARPDETVFYYLFRSNARFQEFDRGRDDSYFAAFYSMARPFMAIFPQLKRMNRTLLGLQVLNVTLMYAKSVVEGILPDNEETEEEIFRVVTTGLASYFEPEVA